MDKEFRARIREAYKNVMEDLEKGARISPYDIGIDWITAFTPIEDNVWSAIRYLGLPLYPQYPIGPYFVDFADPYRRIAIEVDGRAWHKDREADERREDYIRRQHWRIYRIPGKYTYRVKEDFVKDGELDVEKYSTECAEGILLSIYSVYFDQFSWICEIVSSRKNIS